MDKEYKIEVTHDDSGNVVKSMEYDSERLRDRAFQGLLRNMNMGEYTAVCIDPEGESSEGLTN